MVVVFLLELPVTILEDMNVVELERIFTFLMRILYGS